MREVAALFNNPIALVPSRTISKLAGIVTPLMSVQLVRVSVAVAGGDVAQSNAKTDPSAALLNDTDTVDAPPCNVPANAAPLIPCTLTDLRDMAFTTPFHCSIVGGKLLPASKVSVSAAN